MVALPAQIRTDLPIADERSAARRTLRLQVPTESSQDTTEAWIHNLSESGLLLESTARPQVGEELQVELPHSGPTAAIVVWVRGNLAGCEFAAPVSKAAVSAALLRAPAEAAQSPPDIAQEAARHSPTGRELDDDDSGYVSKVMVIVSLLLGLAAAALFVVALLTFPSALF